jgi:hypothetical protein
MHPCKMLFMVISFLIVMFKNLDSRNLVVLSVFLSVLITSSIFLQKYKPSNAQSFAPFTFTAFGDIGFSSQASSTLGLVPQTGSLFSLIVGDLSYSKTRPETEWCNFVKTYVGTEYPFQLVAGNHENESVEIDGTNIHNYTACLPDRMNSVVSPHGRYGTEYYFDYQNMRAIMINADNQDGTDPFDYLPGTNHYNWLQEVIRDAKLSGKWVVVGMHKNCISLGNKSCEIGTALTDLLINEKVDLVLQGHDHNYQRSKQLTCLSPNVYIPGCTSDFDTRGGTYIKDAGTTFVVVGTGGAGLYNINTADSEIGYFSSFSGANISPTSGILKITVSDNQLSAEFIPTTPGAYTDSFVISESGATPTPAPILTTLDASLLADASIRQAEPTRNLGNSTVLDMDYSPIRDSLLKFQVTGVGGRSVQNAKLRIYNTDASNVGGIFYKAADSSWIEKGTGGVTWNTAPAISGAPLGALGSVVAGNWYEVNVTSAIQGDGVFSFRLTSNSTNGANYSSKEAGAAVSPKLILTVIDGYASPGPSVTPSGSPSPEATPSAVPSPSLTPSPTAVVTPTLTAIPTPTSTPTVSQLVVGVSDDTTIRSLSPTSNYSNNLTLETDNDPVKHYLMKFPVSGVAGKTVTKAVIRLTNINSSAVGGNFYTTATNWLEASTNWNNAPALGTLVRTLGRVSGSSTTPLVYDVDVTPVISGDGIYAFRVSSTSGDGADYVSKEGAAGQRPVLILDLQ